MTTIASTRTAPAGVTDLPTLPSLHDAPVRRTTAESATTTNTPDAVGTEFRAIGTTVRLLTTDPGSLAPATDLLRRHLEALDLAASRFRPDSEVSRLADATGEGPAILHASPELAGSVRAALHAARITHGLVDPTVGAAVVASGYDADIDVVRARRGPSGTAVAGAEVPGWRSVTIDLDGVLTVPRGCLLDLGASAKAYAADVVADRLAAHLPGGFLVNLGGDIALSGDTPADGWSIGVDGATGSTHQVVVLVSGQAVATSSTRLRAWPGADGEQHHHIVDPRSGRTAPAQWAQVTCVAASTAAVVLGADAPDWLTAHGIPARLERLDGSVVHTPGWPAVTTEVRR
jgi:thiamine biosynthesis lipoprotein